MRGPGGTTDLRAGARLLRAITRTGVALCAPAAGVGLIMMAVGARGDRVPIENLPGEIGLSLFIFGLLAPFGFWSVHLAVEQWVDESGGFFDGQFSRPVTVAASVAYGLLALGVFTLALLPVLAFTPGEGEGMWGGILGVIVGSICLAVAVSAVAGGVALFGPLGAVVGGLVGAGFIVLVGGGLLTTAPFVRWLGIGLLVLGTAGFLGLRGLARAAGRDV